jgi:hypothetical protein
MRRRPHDPVRGLLPEDGEVVSSPVMRSDGRHAHPVTRHGWKAERRTGPAPTPTWAALSDESILRTLTKCMDS